MTTTQTAQNIEHAEGKEGNTIPPSAKAITEAEARYWCMTIFDIDESKATTQLEIICEKLKSLNNVKWVVGQIELTGTGKPHFQGCLGCTRSERMFKKLRRMFPGIHVEISRNWKFSQSYCTKDESRLVGPLTIPSELIHEINPWRGGKLEGKTKQVTVGKKKLNIRTSEDWVIEQSKLFKTDEEEQEHKRWVKLFEKKHDIKWKLYTNDESSSSGVKTETEEGKEEKNHQ